VPDNSQPLNNLESSQNIDTKKLNNPIKRGGEIPKDDGINTIFKNNKDIENNQGGETPPLRIPTLGQIIGYFKYQSTKEMNAVSNTGVVTRFWQRNYASRVLCGVTNTLSATKKICKTKRITLKQIRCCGMKMTKIQST